MSDQKIDLAIVGATSLVGEALVSLLEERKFSVGRLQLLAGEEAMGKRLKFGTKSLVVESLAEFDFSTVQLTFFAADAATSAEYAQKAADAGSLVIDSSPFFRYELDVPLIVAEVNPERVKDVHQRGIIACPDPLTTQLMIALKPLYDEVGIQRANICTYQAVSTLGDQGVNALAGETAKLLNGKKASASVFEKQVAFNVLPQVGEVMENGYTQGEMMMVLEGRKILQDETISLNPSAAIVPVFFGHSMTIQLEAERDVSVEQAMKLWRQIPGVSVMEGGGASAYPTPVTESSNADEMFIGRIRRDISLERGLNFWIVADNVRKGAALNIIQVAELLEKSYL